MKLNLLKVDTRDMRKGILTNTTPAYQYQNGIRTNNLEGFKYEITFPSLAYEKLNILIPGEIQVDTARLPYEVAIDDLDISLYQSRDGIGVKASASAIKPIGKTS